MVKVRITYEDLENKLSNEERDEIGSIISCYACIDWMENDSDPSPHEVAMQYAEDIIEKYPRLVDYKEVLADHISDY